MPHLRKIRLCPFDCSKLSMGTELECASALGFAAWQSHWSNRIRHHHLLSRSKQHFQSVDRKECWRECRVVRTCIHAHTYTLAHMQTFMHPHMQTCMPIHIRSCMHTFKHAYMQTSTHSGMQTCRHIHAYIPACNHDCLHTCIQEYTRANIHTCKRACLQTHACIHSSMQTCKHTYMSARIGCCLSAPGRCTSWMPSPNGQGLTHTNKKHTYTHTYIHTYVHTYINTYIHTYIHIHTSSQITIFHGSLVEIQFSRYGIKQGRGDLMKIWGRAPRRRAAPLF